LRPLSIVFPYENLHGICGALRALFAVADVCKAMGHNVRVMGDPDVARPPPDPEVKILRHYDLDSVDDYYPLKTLKASDLDESIRLLGMKAWEIYKQSDIAWSFSAIYDRLEDHCERPDMNALPQPHLIKNHWSYQHWPISGDYPHPSAVLYANSTYTQEALRRRWMRESRLCFPYDTLVSPIGSIDQTFDRSYNGPMIEIETESRQISCTPEHPFLTLLGWKSAKDLNYGDWMVVMSNIETPKTLLDSKRIGVLVSELQEYDRRTAQRNFRKNEEECSASDISPLSRSWLKWEETIQSQRIEACRPQGIGVGLLGRNYRWRGYSINADFKTLWKGSEQTPHYEAIYHHLKHINRTYRLDNEKIPFKRSMETYPQDYSAYVTEYWQNLHSLPSTLDRIHEWSNISTNLQGNTPTFNNQEKTNGIGHTLVREPHRETLSSTLLRVGLRSGESNTLVEYESIKKIRKYNAKKLRVYNFSTSSGTYIANGFLVHNCHPPIPLDAYDPSLGYGERDIDVIYIGRVDPLKLGRPPILSRFKDLKVRVVGAENEASFPDYKVDIEWIKNATFNLLAHELHRSKVYVHWKGLLDRSGPEHLGITVLEALASGVPAVVPKAGGPWLDISEKGKYCIGIDSVEEGIEEAKKLATNKDYWEEWHRKAILGAERFGYDVAARKMAKWLSEISG